MKTDSEPKLIKKLTKGSKSAFNQIFNLYHKRVFGLAKYMGLNIDDAQCILQEVFIAIWENKDRISPDKPFEAYILTISKRTILKKLRRLALEDNYKKQAHHSSAFVCQNTEDYIIFKDLMHHANSHIEDLPSSQKQVFMLSKNEGLSNREIAKKLNISIRTVENQLYRATKEVKEAIVETK